MQLKRLFEQKIEILLASKKILMILGARQVGKTTLIKHILKDKSVQYLNFDIEIDKQKFLSASTLDPKQIKAYFGNPDFLILDEAQKIFQTGQIVKGWYDVDIPIKIILLGSSSLDLLNQAAESLTGRNEKIFLTPLLFREVINSEPWFSSVLSLKKIEENFNPQIQTALQQSLVFGNYPEVILSSDKGSLLLNLASDYLYKDIMQLGLIKTPDLLKKLLMLLAHQIGSEVSISELSKSSGISRTTIERYLHILEQTFVIFRLPAFSNNQRKEISKNQKIYFWDTGIRNAILNDFSENIHRSDVGKLWENWVIAEFAKENMFDGQNKNLYFWRSRTGSEVDLIVKENENIEAYEIKWKEQNIKNKSFEDAYGVKVKLIDSKHPLFFKSID